MLEAFYGMDLMIRSFILCEPDADPNTWQHPYIPYRSSHFNDFPIYLMRYLDFYYTVSDFEAKLAVQFEDISFLHEVLHFYDAMRYLIALREGEEAYEKWIHWSEPGGVTLMQQLFYLTTGVRGIDFTIYPSYDAETNSIYHGGHDGWMPSAAVIYESYDASSKLYTSVVDYYYDEAGFVVQRRLAFVYSFNEWGTYTLHHVETIYRSPFDRD
jgi:hypothetical protein